MNVEQDFGLAIKEIYPSSDWPKYLLIVTKSAEDHLKPGDRYEIRLGVERLLPSPAIGVCRDLAWYSSGAMQKNRDWKDEDFKDALQYMPSLGFYLVRRCTVGQDMLG